MDSEKFVFVLVETNSGLAELESRWQVRSGPEPMAEIETISAEQAAALE